MDSRTLNLYCNCKRRPLVQILRWRNPSKTITLFTQHSFYCSQWCSSYRACHWVKGSWDSNPAEDDGFIWAIEISSTTFCRGQVKPSAPYRKILRHVKERYGVWDRCFSCKINEHFSPRFSLLRYQVSLLVFARRSWMNQEWLELRWGTTMDQKMAAVHGTLCTIPTRNSNQ
jgi:hypothetical protein